MKAFKILILSIIFIVSFQYLIVTGYNLIKYNNELKETRYEQVENYHPIHGEIFNLELIDKKKSTSANASSRTYYTYTYDYLVETDNEDQSIFEKKESYNKNELLPTYKVGDQIIFYNNNIAHHPNIWEKEYQYLLTSQHKDNYSNLGYILLGIGILLNVFIGFLILKSIKKEPSQS